MGKFFKEGRRAMENLKVEGKLSDEEYKSMCEMGINSEEDWEEDSPQDSDEDLRESLPVDDSQK
jgi:hypothetical protein